MAKMYEARRKMKRVYGGGDDGGTNKDDDNTDTNSNNTEHVNKATQSVRIPGDIDSDNIQATLNNGLLIVTLPRVNSGTAKEAKIIPIN
jgi:HSP20 family molecular chaperone IbpA